MLELFSLSKIKKYRNKPFLAISLAMDLVTGKIRELIHFGFIGPPYDGMQNFPRMKFLYDSVVEFASCASGVALEIGCHKGCSTIFLSKACLRKGIHTIYAIDLFTGTPTQNQQFDTYVDATSRIKKYGLENNITLIRTHSLDCDWEKAIDVLHIDADHGYSAVKEDMVKFIPFVNDGGIVIFDDYDTAHPGVQKAVHELVGEGDFEIVGVHSPGPAWGSICLRKKTSKS